MKNGGKTECLELIYNTKKKTSYILLPGFILKGHIFYKYKYYNSFFFLGWLVHFLLFFSPCFWLFFHFILHLKWLFDFIFLNVPGIKTKKKRKRVSVSEYVDDIWILVLLRQSFLNIFSFLFIMKTAKRAKSFKK